MARSLPYIMVEHYGVVDVVCTQMFNLKMGNHERLLRLESLFNNCSIWPIAIHKSKKKNKKKKNYGVVYHVSS